MTILILCGGAGTRLSTLGMDLPKPLVPIGERPIIWHVMKGFAHSGFRDFVLCLGHRAESFKHYFLHLPAMTSDVTIDLLGAVPRLHGPDGEESRWRITLAETGINSMTGYRVRRAAERFVREGEPFGVTYGDGVTDLDFRSVVAFHKSHGKIATVTAVHPPGRFGELSFGAGGRVMAFNEKPNTEAGWISGGFFVFSPAIFDYLPDDRASTLEREPLQRLAMDGQLMAYRHNGFWLCMDTPRDHAQLCELWDSTSAPWAVWSSGEEAPDGAHTEFTAG